MFGRAWRAGGCRFLLPPPTPLPSPPPLPFPPSRGPRDGEANGARQQRETSKRETSNQRERNNEVSGLQPPAEAAELRGERQRRGLRGRGEARGVLVQARGNGQEAVAELGPGSGPRPERVAGHGPLRVPRGTPDG